MKIIDIKKAYQLWKKAGLNVASYKREKVEVSNVLRINSSSCFVLEDKSKIIGTILGTFNGRRGWIYHLVIDPKFQKNGYGSMLLQKSEKALKNLGATKIILGVWLNDNEVLNYYQKRGYSIMDDSLTLQKDLWKDS